MKKEVKHKMKKFWNNKKEKTLPPNPAQPPISGPSVPEMRESTLTEVPVPSLPAEIQSEPPETKEVQPQVPQQAPAPVQEEYDLYDETDAPLPGQPQPPVQQPAFEQPAQIPQGEPLRPQMTQSQVNDELKAPLGYEAQEQPVQQPVQRPMIRPVQENPHQFPRIPAPGEYAETEEYQAPESEEENQEPEYSEPEITSEQLRTALVQFDTRLKGIESWVLRAREK